MPSREKGFLPPYSPCPIPLTSPVFPKTSPLPRLPLLCYPPNSPGSEPFQDSAPGVESYPRTSGAPHHKTVTLLFCLSKIGLTAPLLAGMNNLCVWLRINVLSADARAVRPYNLVGSILSEFFRSNSFGWGWLQRKRTGLGAGPLCVICFSVPDGSGKGGGV